MAKNPWIPFHFIVTLVLVGRWLSTVGPSKQGFPNTSSLPIASKLSSDPLALHAAAADFGNLVKELPLAVLRPSSVQDISSLVKFVHDNKGASPLAANLSVTARGHGHSTRGQSMARDGVVIDMSTLTRVEDGRSSGAPSAVSWRNPLGDYIDVGGGMLWIDVLMETLKHGLTPVSWTDYLYLTVGGTLSNAGISGSTFRFGPQISNVYEVDVITVFDVGVGTGEMVTCSDKQHQDLFHAVLGGLGQFGIITRARIALEPAPCRVKWVRLLYTDFAKFTSDQERLISINGRYDEGALEYLEGSVLLHRGSPDSWRSSFFPPSDYSRIGSLIAESGMVYCLEVAKYYDGVTDDLVNEVMEDLLQGLNHIPEFVFRRDVSYVEFLNRVHDGETKLRSEGLWEVPHPWLNLFVPKSCIADFNDGVLKNIVSKNNITTGPVLIYPMNKNKWDDRMSAVIPEEDVFYTIGFLQSAGFDDWRDFESQNEELLRFCEEARMEVKQYIPNHIAQDEWRKHFGAKWSRFQRAKSKFDPKTILSPGQRIFN